MPIPNLSHKNFTYSDFTRVYLNIDLDENKDRNESVRILNRKDPKFGKS
jgi:hypothetical protein